MRADGPLDWQTAFGQEIHGIAGRRSLCWQELGKAVRWGGRLKVVERSKNLGPEFARGQAKKRGQLKVIGAQGEEIGPKTRTRSWGRP